MVDARCEVSIKCSDIKCSDVGLGEVCLALVIVGVDCMRTFSHMSVFGVKGRGMQYMIDA